MRQLLRLTPECLFGKALSRMCGRWARQEWRSRETNGASDGSRSRAAKQALRVLLFIFVALSSTVVTASGPVPPEITSFSPFQQDELVDHFTGDFRYSVPLMEVPGPNGGYPVTLTYASGITPDQDASWVGLGWTLSPGAIVRQMRGVPDDFDPDRGDKITTILDIEPNRTYGLGIAGDYEFFGADTSVGTGISFGLSGYFDNYRGFGISHTVGLSAQTKSEGTTAAVGLNISEDTLEGVHVGASSSLSLSDAARFGADLSFDSRRGLSALSFSAQTSYQQTPLLVSTGNVLNYLGYGKPAALPGTGREMQGSNVKVSLKGGGEAYGNYFNGAMNGFYNFEAPKTHSKSRPAAGYLYLDKAIRSADLMNPDDDATKQFVLDFNREHDGPIYEQSPNLAMPVLTNDLFVVSGRDVVGTFRAYRNDTPAVFDPRQESDITGGAVGVDIGFGNVVKVGTNGVVNHSSTVIGRWDGGAIAQSGAANAVQTLLGTLAKSFVEDPTGYRERTYFKFIGEPSVAPALESIGWKPIAPKLTGQYVGPTSVPAALTTNIEMPPFVYAAGDKDDNGNAVAAQPPTERVSRATLVQAFTNDELRRMANALPDFSASLSAIDTNPDLNLKQRRLDGGNHIGGFRITSQNGTRYVYGISVYNTKYEEQKFSVDRKTLCTAAAAGAAPYCTIIKPPPADADELGLGAAYHYKVAGSEQLLEIKKLSPYPTSYLLTAIIGPDYIDSDGVPGPSDGDVGYWVKFNYALASPTFQWRTPYIGASFVRGPDNGRYIVQNERLSDKGYFSFGAREAWYLTSIETATHKAFMCVDRNARRDGISAGISDAAIGQNETPMSFETPWRLTSVRLFAKAVLAGRTINPNSGCPDGNPLVEAHLDYENYNDTATNAPRTSLVNKAPNGPAGKLTLKRVFFTHLDNTRGKLSPYTFNYGAGDPGQNPDYGDGQRDRWNTYQVPPAPAPPVSGPAFNVPATSPALDDRMAWTDQTSSSNARGSPDNPLDRWAAAWTLRRIIEPTGRTIDVQYEADDYAYVQDKPAMRFFALTSVNAGFPGGAPAPVNPTSTVCPALAGQGDPTVQATLVALPALIGITQGPPLGTCQPPGTTSSTPPAPRIYFKLECDYQGSNCDTDIGHYVDLGADSQILFKIRVALKYKGGDPIKWQTISGYANVRNAGIAGNGVGWIELAPVHTNYPTPLDYHPFAHAAWQYLRLQQPELVRDGGLNGDPNGDPVQEAFNVLTLADAIPELVQSLSGTYPAWLLRGFGQAVDLDNSWIRLKDPDGIKKGGGARVRQITISDGWSASTAGQETDLATGYTYSYRLENGQSSGVAAYEPMVGGEENPLRRAKSFVDQVLLSSDYDLFAELPIGESHYPGPAVGYSRVVRRSLAAGADIRNQATRPHPTSAGPTVYEFYTARDFPVQFSETVINKQRLPFPQVINIPLLGTITVSAVTASQGYLTTINDMHGKPKRVASYQYTDRFEAGDYVLREDPVKETVYQYSSSGGVGSGTSKLANANFPILNADPDPAASPPLAPNEVTATATLAQQSDYVVDLRQNRTESFDGGINLNVDTFLIAYVPIPIPVPMPNFGYSLSETRTVVTSRVVHQAGIVDSIAVREGAARITTRNDGYDPLSGTSLLSESDNPYGHPVYAYQMPARWTYSRMGPAYQDVGRVFDLSSGVFDAQRKTLTVRGASAVSACPDTPPRRPGGAVTVCLPVDSEFAAMSGNGGLHLTLLGSDPATGAVFAVDGDIAAAAPSRAVVTRSGNRNLLTAMTDTIRGLDHPLKARTAPTCIPPPVNDQQSPAMKETHLTGVLEATHVTFLDQWTLGGAGTAASTGNEFATGTRGVFRPHAKYSYRADRSQSSPVDLARDGTFVAALFGRGDAPATCQPVWLPTITHLRYSAAGFELENMDALQIHSASQYGAGGTLPFAVAANARYDEIGFEGFETNSIGKDPDFWRAFEEGEDKVSRASVRVGEGSIGFAERTACLLSQPTGCADRRPVVSIVTGQAHTGKRSLRIVGDQIFAQPLLSLWGGTRYLVSAWVSLGSFGTAATDVATYTHAAGSNRSLGLEVSFQPRRGEPVEVLGRFAPDGPIIDGWQRVEGVFQMPGSRGSAPLKGLSITFLNSTAGNSTEERSRIVDRVNQAPAYFDDFRIQPADASLNAYVYDLATRRMAARLDDNNFATLYRYTPDGKVDLVRRETVRGIFAQQEGRSHLRERP
jgi:hypothetical protein